MNTGICFSAICLSSTIGTQKPLQGRGCRPFDNLQAIFPECHKLQQTERCSSDYHEGSSNSTHPSDETYLVRIQDPPKKPCSLDTTPDLDLCQQVKCYCRVIKIEISTIYMQNHVNTNAIVLLSVILF